MIQQPGLQQNQPKLSKEEQKRKDAEEKKREEYRKKQAEIEKLQMENLQMMYPEYYQQQEAPKQLSNEVEGQTGVN